MDAQQLNPDGKGEATDKDLPQIITNVPKKDWAIHWTNAEGPSVDPISLGNLRSGDFDIEFEVELDVCYAEGCTATLRIGRSIELYGGDELPSPESVVRFSPVKSVVRRFPFSNRSITVDLEFTDSQKPTAPFADELASYSTGFATVSAVQFRDALQYQNLLEAIDRAHEGVEFTRLATYNAIANGEEDPLPPRYNDPWDGSAVRAKVAFEELLESTADPCLAYAAIHSSMLLEAKAGIWEELLARARSATDNSRGSLDEQGIGPSGILGTAGSWLIREQIPLPWRIYAALKESPLLADDNRPSGVALRDLASGATCEQFRSDRELTDL